MSVERAEKRRWLRSANATRAVGASPASADKPATEPAAPPKSDPADAARKGLRAVPTVPTVSADDADAGQTSDLDQLLSDESDPAIDELDALLDAFADEPGEDQKILRALIGDQEAEAAGPTEETTEATTSGDLERDQDPGVRTSGADEDPTMSELDRLLGDDLDDDPAEIDAIEALLAREVEELGLDADPVMNELEGLLATDEEAPQDAEDLDALLSEMAEEVDPLTVELDAALESDDPSGVDAVADILAEEAEEAMLDADPVMSDLDELLAAGDDPLADDAALDAVLEVLNEAADELTADAPAAPAGQDAPLPPLPPLTESVEPLSSEAAISDGWDDLDGDDMFGAGPAEDVDSFDPFADLIPNGRPAADTTDTADGGAGPAGEDETAQTQAQTQAQTRAPDLRDDADEYDSDPIMSELEMILSAELDEGPGYEQSSMLLSEVEAVNFEPLRGKDLGDKFSRPANRTGEPDAEPGRKGEGQQHLDKVIARTGVVPRQRTRIWAWLIWLTILGGLIYVAFLPYSFDVGGNFTIQPIEQSQVRARTDGEIIRVNVEEGDWVNAGDVLAVLSNWDEKRDVQVRQAELEGLRANLETLKAGAKPEEIAVAKEAVRAAEVQVSIAEKDLERQRQLLEHNTISQAVYEDAENKLKVAKTALEQAKAQLVLVTSAARDSEIEAAEAAVRRSEQELAFSKLIFEQTNIRAVSDGQIVSSLDEVPVGAFLVEGALFCVIEDNRVVKAEIEVPETDISEVKVGALVELKLWSEAEASFTGEVERIAPVAEERDFGRIVRVVVRVENPDGLLTSNTTGYAKISAREAPVWEVFTRMFVTFFRIELWSWVP